MHIEFSHEIFLYIDVFDNNLLLNNIYETKLYYSVIPFNFGLYKDVLNYYIYFKLKFCFINKVNISYYEIYINFKNNYFALIY